MTRRLLLAIAAACALTAATACSTGDGVTARSTSPSSTSAEVPTGSLMVFTPVDPDGGPVELDEDEMQAFIPRLKLWLAELGVDDTVRVVDGTYVVPGDPETDLPIDATALDERRIVHVPHVEFRPVLQTFVGETEETTPAENSESFQTVIADGERRDDGSIVQYELGPAFFGGEIVEDATTSFENGQWVVLPIIKPGGDGLAQFNDAAQLCNTGAPACPPTVQGGFGEPVGALAFVVDGTVISAPAINASSFERDQIQISGSFDEAGAKHIALAMRVSLPFDLRLA